MFQVRIADLDALKGAIDRTIAEEQARQKSPLETPATGNPAARRSRSSSSATQSAARRPRPIKKTSDDLTSRDMNGDGVATNPDPAVFEAAFVIDDADDTAPPSRSATPALACKTAKPGGSGKDTGKAVADTSTTGDNGAPGAEQAPKAAPATFPASSELPPEVRARLRKLEKLEKTYPELLRSYRIAHSRATSIEPFERALKETTPLTSIKDPEALVEYLNQINLKGDMVMEELKRVTAEKDTYKKKADDAEEECVVLGGELAALKTAKSQTTDATESGSVAEESKATAEGRTAPPAGGGSGDGADFFPYETEIPQLQADVQKKTEEIEKLRTEVHNLQDELSLTKEHSAGLVESLENATRELAETKDAVASKTSVETQLEARNTEITTLTDRLNKAQTKLKELEAQAEKATSDAAEAVKETSTQLAVSASRNEELEKELGEICQAKSSLDSKIEGLTSEIEALKKSKAEDESKINELGKHLQSTAAPAVPSVGAATPEASLAPPAGGGKKKNKKKKKGPASATAAAPEPTPSEAAATDHLAPPPSGGSTDGELQAELARLHEELAEKDQRIETLSKQRKTEEYLREEIENLRDNLVTIGQNHVEARERIKELEAERRTLQERISELEKEVESSASTAKAHIELRGEHESLTAEFDNLKMKSSTLQSDLAAAQQLAQTRYKDLTELKEVLQKAQPELKSLRQDAAALKTTREELGARNTELRSLEKREKELKTEVARAQRLVSDRESEIKSLHEKVTLETNTRLRLEDEKRTAGRDLRRAEAERIELSAREEKATRELQRSQEEAAKLRPRIRELEDETARLKREQDVLREETDLKTSQYSNAQSLLGSMRDQTAELSIQLKESQSQCESLDEELAEARKMLGERTREAETMRRLLADVDERADGKVREMRARMDAAVEERDRLEDESSALARRKSRESEELKQKVRDLEREVKALAGEKDELEHEAHEWRRRRDELEAYEEKAGAEVAEMRTTQVRDTEKRNAELRRALDDYRLRYDKLGKEAKTLQAKLAAPAVAGSVRGSMDSTRSGGGLNGQQAGGGSPDAMYLKTILLQFLEQKDNRLRAQLVPVLGKLLKFDKADEQKWLAAIQHINSR
ncbi:hypothetical protein BT67DRAFT_450343 [Trichocladium antarcticum]|uniref:GRIP domain-containing protein n=1 Tax=Trichocladium antarcticum TaxID=1450529 RepID=A0AAN6ZD68_9PEZI|nr:hypothetical protein BT67DRAFT_450343 [Trichocladium antarcticum]